VGACGSGKTHQAINLVRDYVDHGCIDRVMVVSPTFASNPAFDALQDVISIDDVYTAFGREHESIADVQRKVIAAGESYRNEKRYKEVYDLWLQSGRDTDSMTANEKSLLEQENFREARDPLMPSIALIIDDCSHSPIFLSSTDNPFTNLCLRHRHVGGIGLTIIFCVQTYRSGVPKALRQGCIRQIALFPTKDHSQLDAVYDEVGNLVSKAAFMKAYRDATRGSDHNFLLIDSTPDGRTYRERKLMRFRKNWDHLLLTENDDSSDEEDGGYSKQSDDDEDDAADAHELRVVSRPIDELIRLERGPVAASKPSAAAADPAAKPRFGVWKNGFSGWEQAYAAQERAAAEINREIERRARTVIAANGGRAAVAQIRQRTNAIRRAANSRRR